MRKILGCLFIIFILTVLTTASCSADSSVPDPAGDGTAEWTVLFYFCGSDLESKYGYASANLADISDIMFPFNALPVYYSSGLTRKDMMRAVGNVNILFQTGGSYQWYAQSLGLNISPKALQRWRFDYYPDEAGELPEEPFQLLETLPLQSMSDPETLSDFIRWGARTCPARKYALVLWGHGSGGETGLLVDELFDKDVMYLYELKQALSDGGIFFDTLVLDACMMCNIETAWNVKDSARWMVGSEEVVPGEGTAISSWLQALVNHPALDGKWLARSVCDMTEIKYSNIAEESGERLLTWSIIDLTKIEPLVEVAGRLVQVLNDAMRNNPEVAKVYIEYLAKAEIYGDVWLDMIDFGSVVSSAGIIHVVDNYLLDEVLKALTDAVIYVTRGSGRSSAGGLSFCYPAGCTEKELDIYSLNFPMPRYLAFLDCISSWKAPEWIYEHTERLPKLDDITQLQVTVEKRMTKGNIPALDFSGTSSNVDDLFFWLYREDEKSGEIVLLGKTDCLVDIQEDRMLWRAENLTRWFSIDEHLCCMELVQSAKGRLRLYNIPVQIGTDISILRCGQERKTNPDGTSRLSGFEIYGVWEGYDIDSDVPSRSVESLSILAGREYRTVFPYESSIAGGKTYYAFGQKSILPRALDVAEIALPPGTYYLEYEIQDLFMRTAKLDRIEFRWDGQAVTFPEDFTWEGNASLAWSR